MLSHIRTMALVLTASLALGQTAEAQSVDSIITALAPNYGTPSGTASGQVPASVVTLIVPQTSIQLQVDTDRNVDFELYFAFDSAVLTVRGKDVLNKLGRALVSDELNTQRFLLAGHTDASGDETYNMQLSEARAVAAKDYLSNVFAIDEERLISAGYGETRLAIASEPYSAANRRVAITLIPDFKSNVTQTDAKSPATATVDIDLSNVQITVGIEQDHTGDIDCSHRTTQGSAVALDQSLDSYGTGPTRLPCDSGVFEAPQDEDNFVNSVISN